MDVIGIITACALAANAAKADPFESPIGKFSVEFPAVPVLSRSRGHTAKATLYEELKWGVLSNGGYWAVTMIVYANPRKLDYETKINAAVAAVQGRLTSQKSLIQCAVEGREILIEAPNSRVIRERMLWIGGRLHCIIFGGSKKAATSPEVDKFLDSFGG
jgi:hypothetical protein